MSNRKYHSNLATYFSSQPHFFDGDQQKKPHIRKCIELPFQQTQAHLWDEVTDTLCDLEFIQAKACAKMTYDLAKDFYSVLQWIPDNYENIIEENERQTRMYKYTRDLIACANAQIKPWFLRIPETVPLWNEEKINYEIERMKTIPTRLDCLKDFQQFLGQEAGNLQNYAHEFPFFAMQQAWNYADNGPVGLKAEKGEPDIYKFLLLCTKSNRPKWNPLSQRINTLIGHTNAVEAVAITPDGKMAISGSRDKTCIIHDLNTGEVINTLIGHTDTVNAVAITPDARMAISGSSDMTCIIWDLKTGLIINTLKGHSGDVKTVAISANGKRAISNNYMTCIIWDLDTGYCVFLPEEHSAPITAVDITPDGSIAISGSMDNTCIIWNLNTGGVITTLEGHTKMVQAVAITPDGNRAISSSYDNTCIIWDLNTGQEINTLNEDSIILAVDITPDGKRALSCTTDICILWDANTGHMIKSIKAHSFEFLSVAITPEGKHAIIGCSDATCIIWDFNTLQDFNNLSGHISRVTSVSITPDGKKAVSASYDKTCILWDIEHGKVIKTLNRQSSSISCLVITPDNKKFITCAWEDKTLTLWDLTTGQAIKTLIGHSGRVNGFAITPDGKRAISHGDQCIIWNLNTGQAINTLKGSAQHILFINAIIITPDGKRVLTCSWENNTCIIWDMSTGQMINTLKGNTKVVIAITPDGRRAITGSMDNTCIIWDLSTGQIIKTLKGNTFGHNFLFNTIAISADGKRVFSRFGDDKTCTLLDLESEKKIAQVVMTSSIDAITLSQGSIVGGESSGKIFILNLDKVLLCRGVNIITIRQIWDFELQQFLSISADCPLCGHRFTPTATILATIDSITMKAGLKPEQSPCLELPDESWEDPGLLGNCPKCGCNLKFNPFIAGGDN